jgi:alpha-glucosidase
MSWRQEAQSRWLLNWRLEQSEQCWGLGERYGGLNLRGRVHTLVATDDDQHLESTDSLYKCIPFLTVLKDGTAYGVFLDSPAPQRWDLDSDRSGNVQVRLLSRRAWQLYWFERQSLPHILAAYSCLTGRSNLPPQWSLGHQQSRWSYPTERKVREIAREFRARKIPCDTIVLDIDYMHDYRAFTISRERFPQFERMVTDLLRLGFRVVTIVDPAVKKSVRDASYRSGLKLDAFCKNSDGTLFVGRVWPGHCCLPDFMRNTVRDWWGRRLNFLLSRGVAGIWNDMNEPALFGNQRPLSADAQELPKDDQQLFLQSTGQGTIGHFEVRNLYGHQMARSTSDALQTARPNERQFVLTRSGYAGIQRYSAVWLGDNRSWFEHLRLSVPMLLNMSLSGVPFCGVDIGGFGGSSDAELLLRWYQLGIFYPFCRNHCALDGRSQEPWAYGPRVEKTIRRLIGVRYQLIPYFEQLFVEHRKTGAPLMRPLCWHYPGDRTALQLDDQFLLGSDLLIAPIVHRGRTRRPVYLPKGRWFRFDGGPAWLGGRYYDVEWTTDNIPAFVRKGAILPIAGSVQHSSQLATASITFRCYGNPAKGRYWQDDGSSLGYQRGEYNEWILSLKSRTFRAKCVHQGFRQPDRRYFYEAGGWRFPLKWASKVTDTD